jgi:hypothetical protein
VIIYMCACVYHIYTNLYLTLKILDLYIVILREGVETDSIENLRRYKPGI